MAAKVTRLEVRLAQLERELKDLKAEVRRQQMPWWKQIALGRRAAPGSGVILPDGLPANLELPAHCQRQQNEAPRAAQSRHGITRSAVGHTASTPTLGGRR